MKHHQPTQCRRRNNGFSLIEMLVVIAVIGIISSMALPSVSNVNDSAEMARDQRNAQNICSLFNGAKVSGVAFASATKEEILDELIAGVSAPDTGIDYKFTPLTDDQKAATLAYCEYDADQELMKYNSVGGVAIEAAPAASEPEWGPWILVGDFVNYQVAGFIASEEAAYPNRQYTHYYSTDGHSFISYRELQ